VEAPRSPRPFIGLAPLTATPMNTTPHVGAAMPESKWCPTCQHSLPLQAFGPDRSRPPLFLQGRCRPCVTIASSAARARTAERAKATPLDFDSELAAINLELEKVTTIHRKDPSDSTKQVALLAIPMRDRRRRPANFVPTGRESYDNWRVLLPWPLSRTCVNKNSPDHERR
jgi:hypothetical protein